MDKVIQIDGKEVGFRATALTPRFYRHKIGRDIMQDMNQLQKSFDRVKTAKKYESKEYRRCKKIICQYPLALHFTIGIWKTGDVSVII